MTQFGGGGAPALVHLIPHTRARTSTYRANGSTRYFFKACQTCCPGWIDFSGKLVWRQLHPVWSEFLFSSSNNPVEKKKSSIPFAHSSIPSSSFLFFPSRTWRRRRWDSWNWHSIQNPPTTCSPPLASSLLLIRAFHASQLHRKRFGGLSSLSSIFRWCIVFYKYYTLDLKARRKGWKYVNCREDFCSAKNGKKIDDGAGKSYTSCPKSKLIKARSSVKAHRPW